MPIKSSLKSAPSQTLSSRSVDLKRVVSPPEDTAITPFGEYRYASSPWREKNSHAGITFTAPSVRPIQRQKTPPKEIDNTGLPHQLKTGIETLAGISMGHVKVHYNSQQPAKFNAHAYAQGGDIHLAPGQEKHLPHEAWHVVQQAQGRVKPTMQMKAGVPVNDDAGLEREADLMGENAAQRVTRLNSRPALNTHEKRHVVQQKQSQGKSAMQMNRKDYVSDTGQVIQAKFKIGTYEDNHNPADAVDDTDLNELYSVLGLEHEKSLPFQSNLKHALTAVIKNYRKKYAKKDEKISTGDALEYLKTMLKSINSNQYGTNSISSGTFPKQNLGSFFVMYDKHAQNIAHDPAHQTFLPPVGIGGGMNTPLNLTQTNGAYLGFSPLEKGLFGLSKVTKLTTKGIEIESAQVSNSTTPNKTLMVSGNDENTNVKIRKFFENVDDTSRDSKAVWNGPFKRKMIERRKKIHGDLLNQSRRRRLQKTLKKIDVVHGIPFSTIKYNKSTGLFNAGTIKFTKAELFKILTKKLKKIHEEMLEAEIISPKISKSAQEKISNLKMERALTRSVRNLLKQDNHEISVIFNKEKYHAESAIRRNVKKRVNLSIDKVGGTKVPCTECHTGYSLDNQKNALILNGALIGGMYSTDKTLAQNSDVNPSSLATQQLVQKSLTDHYHGSQPHFLGGVGDLSMSQVYQTDEGDYDTGSDISDDETMNDELFEEDVNAILKSLRK